MAISKRKALLWAYLVALHAIVFVCLTKTNLIEKIQSKFSSEIIDNTQSKYYRSLVAFHARIDNNLPNNSIIFIGDSHIQGLAISAVTEPSANYGIGKDTTTGVIKRLPQYTALNHAKAVVLAIGFNDLVFSSPQQIGLNLEQLVQAIPGDYPIYLNAVFPVGDWLPDAQNINRKIVKVNAYYQELANIRKRVHYLQTFNDNAYQIGLSHQFLLSDGIHLSKEGNQAWISMLKEALSQRENK